MTTLRLLSTLAFAGVARAMMPAFQNQTGIMVDAEFLPTAALMPRLRAGEQADAVLLTEDGIASLASEDRVRPGSAVAIARSFIGLAVAAGAPHPEIGTVDAFIATLRAARAIGMARQGASGIYLAGLIERLGIADWVRAKAVIIETGLTGELVADGRADVALQQVSELMVVPGIEVVGRMPAELGGETVFSGAILRDAREAEAAQRLLAALAGARELIAEKGLQPL